MNSISEQDAASLGGNSSSIHSLLMTTDRSIQGMVQSDTFTLSNRKTTTMLVHCLKHLELYHVHTEHALSEYCTCIDTAL